MPYALCPMPYALCPVPFNSITIPYGKTMNDKSSIPIFVFLLIFTFFVSGCGPGAPPGFPQVVPCEISVLKDGVPLPQVTVILVSDGAKEWFASGETDASGVTKINTSINSYSQAGVPEGTYKVTFNQIPQVKVEKSQQELFDMAPVEKAAYQAKMEQLIKESRSFPLEFESHLTTPIFVEITKAKSKYVIDVSQWITK